MATNAQIFDVRLRISDPPGFIQFIDSALPAAPASQTAYLLAGNYYSTDKTSAAPSDYSVEDLLVSDIRISTWIDLSGSDYAVCQSLKSIISQIGRSLQIKKNATGADTTEYQTLKDTYDFYKEMLALCSEDKKSNDGNNSGRWGQSLQPEIAGGNL